MSRKLLKSAVEIASKRRTSLGYKAIEGGTNRRQPQTRTTAEAFFLNPQKQARASGTVRDDRRNFTILAWMIRKHLDSVSRFTPYIDTGDDKLDALVLKLLRIHSSKRRFDALGRHGRDEWMRMFEATKVIEGDAAGLKTPGFKLQGIEGDRLAIPTGGLANGPKNLKDFSEDGVKYNDDGTRSEWVLCKRSGVGGNTLEYEATVKDADLIYDGYWPERFDATRGVSPLLTALSEGADVRETYEWLVLKAKTSALFGLAFTRKGSDPLPPTAGDPNTEAPENESTAYGKQVAAGIKARSIINLDLDEGDEVKEIQSSTPNPQVLQFTRDLIRCILLALDIPFTLFDSLASSFSARIADRNEYDESCESKRDKNIDVLNEIYGEWLFPLWAKSDFMGFGKALKAAGRKVEDVAADLEWMAAGRPWLDRTSEMAGHILALSAGVESVPEVCAIYGKNAYNVARIQKKYLERCGIPILLAASGQVPVNDLLKQSLQPKNEGTSNAPDSPPQV